MAVMTQVATMAKLNVPVNTLQRRPKYRDRMSTCQVELLRSEVHCQRELILKLQQQLRSVLSVLGITEQAIQLTVIDELTNNTKTCQLDTGDHLVGQSPRAECAATTQLLQEPYHPGMKTQRKLVTSFQQSLVATVYVDQSEQ